MKTSPKVLWASALAAIFLVAHLAFLPPTLEDLDSMNFALGVRDFDPSKHQPHPPGYPVFIALGKLSHAVWPSDAGSLSLWGALFGALSVFPLVALFRSIEALDRTAADAERDRRAALATLVVVASPLFWFTALRPLSDMPGLGMALAAQACLAAAFVRRRRADSADPAAIGESGRLIVAGALIAGLAVGMRTQTIWLTLPLLAAVLLDRAGRGAAGALLGSAMTFSIGVLAWAIPLLIASGGLARVSRGLRRPGRGAVHRPRHLPEQSDAAPDGARHHCVAGRSVGRGAARMDCRCHCRCGIRAAGLARAATPRRCCSSRTCRTRSFISSSRSRTAGTRCRSCLPSAIWSSEACPRLERKRPTFGSAAIVVASLLVTLPAAKAYSQYPSPAYAAINDLQQRRVERSGQCGRRASAVRARARDREMSREDSAVAGHARVDRACGVLARRRPGAACGTCRILLAAISSWSIR